MLKDIMIMGLLVLFVIFNPFLIGMIACFIYNFLYRKGMCTRCIMLEYWDGYNEYRCVRGPINPKLLNSDGKYKDEVILRRKQNMKKMDICFMGISLLIVIIVMTCIL